MENKQELELWEKRFIAFLTSSGEVNHDASHDLGHFQRVYAAAKEIAERETAPVDFLILLAAAYFHDIVCLPKNHPNNSFSSRYAAAKAREILNDMQFPSDKIDGVCHAIEAHSFSAGIPPTTLEAKILQDADRMEALGALGVLRTFYVSGRLERQPYDPKDLYAKSRPLDDKAFGLDHFYVKLFKLPSMLQTEGGRHLAESRSLFLEWFVKELESGLSKNSGGALDIVWGCYHAGQKGAKLFHQSMPLGEGRNLTAEEYALDLLIQNKENDPDFHRDFTKQLAHELLLTH